MGFLDYLKEKNRQKYEEEVERINEEYEDDPVERDRALRRLEALHKPSRPQLMQSPPDISNMGVQELETLYKQIEVEIQMLEKVSNTGRDITRVTGDAIKSDSPILAGIFQMLSQSNFDSVDVVERKKLLAAIEGRLKDLQQQQQAVTPPQVKLARLQNLMDEWDKLKQQSDQRLWPDIDRLYQQLMDDERKKP